MAWVRVGAGGAGFAFMKVEQALNAKPHAAKAAADVQALRLI